MVTLAISALCPGMGSPDDEIYDILFDAQVLLKESQMLSKARIILYYNLYIPGSSRYVKFLPFGMFFG